MSIQTRWFDEQREVILWEFEGAWTLDEFQRAYEYTRTLCSSVQHRVSAILDLRATHFAPAHLNRALAARSSNDPLNLDGAVLVSQQDMFRELAHTLNAMPGNRGRYCCVDSLEAAQTQVIRRQQEQRRAVEARARLVASWSQGERVG